MTCKTDLIDTVTTSQRYWATWMADTETGEATVSIPHYSTDGADSYFPKCYHLNNTESQVHFYEEFVQMHAESYLKKFLRAEEKGLFGSA